MAVHRIDLATWPRRDHFQLFRSQEWPYFSLTVEVDLSTWLPATRAAGRPFYTTLVHEVMTAVNRVEALRTRIRGDEVVLHDQVDVSFTVPWREELFNFCLVDFTPDREAFLARSQAAIAHAQAADGLLLDDPARDGMIFISCLPWLPFTSMTHPVHSTRGDSIPRISWGRVIERDGRLLLPLNLQLHHGLADGVHVARFVEALNNQLMSL